MLVSTSGNLTHARSHAQENANVSGVPWVVFKDTSGNMRIERLARQSPDLIIEIVHPASMVYDLSFGGARATELGIVCSHTSPPFMRLVYAVSRRGTVGSLIKTKATVELSTVKSSIKQFSPCLDAQQLRNLWVVAVNRCQGLWPEHVARIKEMLDDETE